MPWQAPKIRGGAFPARGVWGAKRPHKKHPYPKQSAIYSASFFTSAVAAIF